MSAHRKKHKELSEDDQHNHLHFLRQIIKYSPTLIAGVDSDLRFFAHSRRYISDFNLPFADLCGRHLQEVFPNIAESWLKDFRQCLGGEVIGPKKLSTEIPAFGSQNIIRQLIPLKSIQGETVGVIVVNEFTTERDQATEALRVSEMRYKTLAESTFEAIFISENGIGIETNARATEMFGYAYDEIIGMFGPTVVAEKDRQMVTERMLSGYPDPYEMLALRKDGSTFHAEIRGKNIDYLDQRKKVRVSVVRDIDKEKKAIFALQESERKYRDLVENINDVIYTISPEGCLSYVSPAIQHILGYQPEEIVGSSFLEFVHPEDYQYMSRKFVQKKQQEGLPSECRLLHKDGSHCWIRVSTKPFIQDGDLIEMNGVLTDISREKCAEIDKQRLEEQLQQAKRMEAIGTLAGGVAHDLNNILSGIVTYPELLLHDMSLENPHRTALETIKKSGERAAAIVQDMLALGRKGIREVEQVDINELIIDYLNSPEAQTLKSYHPDVAVTFTHGKDLPFIDGSPVHLKKIIMNLVINGAESMEKGGQLTITTREVSIKDRIVCNGQMPENNYIEISIADCGAGISSRELDRIFEPFYSTKRLGRSGTGLGMAVVWRSVEDHQGFIDIHSCLDQGTTLEVFFPVSTKQMERPKSLETGLADIMGDGQTILLVDDKQTQLEIGQSLLQKLGYIVSVVSSGEDAVDYLLRHKCDLVIVDMIMEPGQDGLDTFKQILTNNPGQLALIASGYAKTSRVKDALDLGMKSYIRKPYSIKGLGSAVKSALNENLTSS